MDIIPINSKAIEEIKWEPPNFILIKYKSHNQFYTYKSTLNYFSELKEYSCTYKGEGVNRKILKDMGTKIQKIENKYEW